MRCFNFCALMLNWMMWAHVLLHAHGLDNEYPSKNVPLSLEDLRCGQNSLFMFLVLSGHPGVRWDQLQRFPVSAEGTSLLALRDAARVCHVRTEIRKYGLRDLDRMPLPAVVQLISPSATPTHFHFSVVYKLDDRSVYLLDGTSGTRMRWGRRFFNRYWTGIALTEHRLLSPIPADEEWMAAVVLLLLLPNSMLLAKALRRGSASCTGGTMM